MKKKDYERPSIEVVELKQQQQLLAGSVTATMDGTFTETDLAREFDFEDDDFLVINP